jgi:hypothetical protein
MYDDDMFIWYDSDLCMRALCMVFIPPRAKLVLVFPHLGIPKQVDYT